MTQLPDYLRPSRPAPRDLLHLFALGWLAAAGALWLLSPFPFLPQPGEVLSSLLDLWQTENLGQNLLTSFTLNLEAIALASLLSLFLAYLSTFALFSPLVAAWGKLRFLSMYGLVFFFTMLTSSGHALKLSMLVFGVSVFFTISMADVISAIPQEKFDLARTLRMGDWEVLWEVVVLGTAAEGFVVLRQNAAMALILLGFVESIERSEGGIGALLATSDKYFHMAAIMAIQLLVLIYGLGQDCFIAWLRITLCPYADLTRRRG
jgi:NitT/TauT family transport system permease protein